MIPRLRVLGSKDTESGNLEHILLASLFICFGWSSMIFQQKSHLNELLGDEPHPDAVVGLPPTLGVAGLVDDRHHVAGLEDEVNSGIEQENSQKLKRKTSVSILRVSS